MRMVLVLVLSCVLAVTADSFHEDIYFHGCSDTDAEDIIGLDNEEMWFADFEKGKGVDPQPDFVRHMNYPTAYEGAVANIAICKHNLETCRKGFKGFQEQRDAPSTPIVYPKDEVELGEINVLVCHVTGFFPAPVTIKWKKNGENVTKGISTNVPLPNEDSTFSQFSKLEFIPQLGDIYSCSVNHMALDQPLTRMYDVKQTGSGLGPALFCGFGLTAGLLGVAAGTFFFVRANERG